MEILQGNRVRMDDLVSSLVGEGFGEQRALVVIRPLQQVVRSFWERESIMIIGGKELSTLVRLGRNHALRDHLGISREHSHATCADRGQEDAIERRRALPK